MSRTREIDEAGEAIIAAFTRKYKTKWSLEKDQAELKDTIQNLERLLTSLAKNDAAAKKFLEFHNEKADFFKNRNFAKKEKLSFPTHLLNVIEEWSKFQVKNHEPPVRIPNEMRLVSQSYLARLYSIYYKRKIAMLKKNKPIQNQDVYDLLDYVKELSQKIWVEHVLMERQAQRKP